MNSAIKTIFRCVAWAVVFIASFLFFMGLLTSQFLGNEMISKWEVAFVAFIFLILALATPNDSRKKP